jgi:hypothetical protein
MTVNKKPEYRILPIDTNNPDGGLKISFGFVQDGFTFDENDCDIPKETLDRVEGYGAGIMIGRVQIHVSKPLNFRSLAGTLIASSPEIKTLGIVGKAFLKTDKLTMKSSQGNVTICTDNPDALVNKDSSNNITHLPAESFDKILASAICSQTNQQR